MEPTFFFCYDYKLSNYLKGRGIRYVTKALHFNNQRPFTLYIQTPELAKVIEEWKSLCNN